MRERGSGWERRGSRVSLETHAKIVMFISFPGPAALLPGTPNLKARGEQMEGQSPGPPGGWAAGSPVLCEGSSTARAGLNRGPGKSKQRLSGPGEGLVPTRRP